MSRVRGGSSGAEADGADGESKELTAARVPTFALSRCSASIKSASVEAADAAGLRAVAAACRWQFLTRSSIGT